MRLGVLPPERAMVGLAAIGVRGEQRGGEGLHRQIGHTLGVRGDRDDATVAIVENRQVVVGHLVIHSSGPEEGREIESRSIRRVLVEAA